MERGGAAEAPPAEASLPGPRYISLLPVIPVTLRLHPSEALEGRRPQDGRGAWPGPWEAGPKAPSAAQAPRDVTLYK